MKQIILILFAFVFATAEPIPPLAPEWEYLGEMEVVGPNDVWLVTLR